MRQRENIKKFLQKGLIFLLCNPIILFSQNFNYLSLGEKELANLNVYSIAPLPDNKLYISTNNGFFEYRYGNVEQIFYEKDLR